LSDDIFGVGYIKIEEISDRYLVVWVDGKFAGFANTDIWDDEEISESPSGLCLGLIETVAVHSDYRGLGLGTILVAAATAHLIQEGAALIECYATTWSNSGICYLAGSLARNGFLLKEKFPQAWKDEDQDYVCRACATTPCLCDATLYCREVNTR
jgi:GNAT superfamily N-acetyltransferase